MGNDNIYVSIKEIIMDKCDELGKSQQFKKALCDTYLNNIVELIEEIIDNELEFLTIQSRISKL